MLCPPPPGKTKYMNAYRQILATRDSIDMWFIKVILLGAPRLGKTTVRRRLTGKIDDISSSGEAEQPSTGAVETAPSVIIRNLTSSTALVTPSEWSISKDLVEEACMFLHFFYSHVSGKTATRQHPAASNRTSGSDAATSENEVGESLHNIERRNRPVLKRFKKFLKKMKRTRRSRQQRNSPLQSSKNKSGSPCIGVHEVADLFHKAMDPRNWKDIKVLFNNTALMKMEDTGGQPEFMDMLPALTIGPALYLFFCKLIDDLQSLYTVSYLSPSGESTTPVQSTYTVEEVLLSALASVSCFKSYSLGEASKDETTSATEEELLASCNKSVVYILGTYKDLVTEEEIAEFDKKLQHSIRSTDFFREDLVQFSSEDRMVLPIDNMYGGGGEVKKVRKFLEEGMKHHFKKLSIPAAWLVLSLCLRKREERTATLQSVLQLAGELDIPEKEAKLALWFLHHYAGVLMYFPNLEELEDTVICDIQVVYDSVSSVIVNTFKFGSVSKAASEKFRETGQFSLHDISKATASISGDYIPLLKLVKLLGHLNIIAPITPSTSSQASSSQSSEVTYFMPCVLQNATRQELDKWWDCNSNPLSPAPLFIRYKCGFVPIGVFPAMIARLASNNSLRLVPEYIKKNRVQFRMLTLDCDTIALISQPRYYAIHIARSPTSQVSTREVCTTVRRLVESTLKTVTSGMNYSFNAEYQLSFECPSHPGREHLCVIENENYMFCLSNAKNPQPVPMQSEHRLWLQVSWILPLLFGPTVQWPS